MKVAISQMDTTMGDLSGTVARMVAQSKLAGERGVDLLAFPAPALTGHDPAGLLVSEGFLSDLSAALDQLAEGLACPCLVPFMMDFGEGPGLECALVAEGTVTPLHLAAYMERLVAGTAHTSSDTDDEASDGDEADAMDALADGGPVAFSLAGAEVGIALDSLDLVDFAEGRAEADVIFYLPFSGYDADDEATCLAPSISEGSYLKLASEANSWLVAVGAVGGYDEAVFTGGSFVLAPWGQLACALPSFEEAFQVVDIDVMSEGPLATPLAPPAYERMAHLWEALVLSTRDLCRKGGRRGVCLQLDGSLTSSVLAVLASDAVGPANVHALVSPALGEEALSSARLLARNLHLDVRELADAAVAETALGLGVDEPSDLAPDLAAVLLADMSRRDGALVLSDLDKTAAAVRGRIPSLAADFAPLADVYRSDVAALARQRNTISPVIPAECLRRLCVPTDLGLDEMSDTDEGRLSELDAILLLHVEQGLGLSAITVERDHGPVVSRILDRVQACEPARRQTPPFPVVSERTFDERAWPLTLEWHDRPRDPDDAVDEDEALGRIEEFLRSVSATSQPTGATGPDEAGALGFISDLAQGGGMRIDGDDLWGTGLFSKN
jgi:NAD+ synthase (glutamine-hydrolysing)